DETRSLRDQRTALRDADLILLPSAAALLEIERRYPEVARCLRLVPHGVDDSPQALAAARHQRRNFVTALYAGRFDEMKGVDVLLASVPLILQQHPQASIVIAGGLPASRRAEARWLRQWRI